MSDAAHPHQSERRSDTDIYQLFSSSRRRQTIWCLAIADTWQMPLRHIASHIAAYDQNESVVDVPRGEVTEIYHSLKRYHIGPLTALDVVTLGENETIHPGPRFFEILSVLVHSQSRKYTYQTT